MEKSTFCHLKISRGDLYFLQNVPLVSSQYFFPYILSLSVPEKIKKQILIDIRCQSLNKKETFALIYYSLIRVGNWTFRMQKILCSIQEAQNFYYFHSESDAMVQ